MFTIDACTAMLSQSFSPKDLDGLAKTYIASGKGLPRLLYSEISSQFFAHYRKSEDMTVVISNAESLLRYASDMDGRDDVQKTLLRLCDHCMLVANQLQAMKDVTGETLADRMSEVDDKMTAMKKDMEATGEHIKNDVKAGIQREYIAILGIFASIVLAFTGSFAFSSSVLQHMRDVPAERLAAVCTFVFLLFVNMMGMLTGLIRDMMGRKIGNISIYLINVAGLLVLAVIFWKTYTR